MAVPNLGQVGAIIGKGGEVISQLKSVIGVKIRISDRDDFLPGTRNRKVTISGAADAVQIAQVLFSILLRIGLSSSQLILAAKPPSCTALSVIRAHYLHALQGASAAQQRCSARLPCY